MPSSTTLRKQIETVFANRYPSVLTPVQRTVRKLIPAGIAEIDNLLEGGLPVGAISELTGPFSSGRTTIAQSFVAQQTKLGAVCAWVDSADTLDPESAAANGVSLAQLLWVRCKCDEAQSNRKTVSNSRSLASRAWTRLDQALRATDLLLQSGGFRSIVLDIGNETIEHGRRIPLATWFRFRQAADRTRCSLIVLGKASYAQSSAAVVLECQAARTNAASNTVLREFSFITQRRRERFSSLTSIDRKPPASDWSAVTSWNAERRA